MTSGSWSLGGPVYYYRGLYLYKWWYGSDGKYDASEPNQLQWNDYQVTGRSRTRMADDSLPVYGDMYTINSWPTWAIAAEALGWYRDNRDLRVVAGLAEKIRGHSFNLGVNLVEAHKSYELILGNLSQIGRALRAVRRGNITGALRHLRVPPRGPLRNRRTSTVRQLSEQDASGRWLEMQYGWLPLVYDSYEAAKALEKYMSRPVLKFTHSTTMKGQLSNPQHPTYYSFPTDVSLTYRIHAELSEELDWSTSLGMQDPATVLWELTPYSFVVDWFIPVGTFLEARSIIPRLKGRFMRSRNAQTVARTLYPTSLGASLGYKTDPYRTFKGYWYYRLPTTSLEVPRPHFRPLPKALSPRKILSAISLIHQRLSN